MTLNTRPIQFRDYLPEVFQENPEASRTGEGEIGEPDFLRLFLQSFEALFEELQAEIEGTITTPPTGGIPDLFSPVTTPPPQFNHLPQDDFDYLNYLAGWIGLPLRSEKSLEWNRQFFRRAITLHPQRSTLPGMIALLQSWLKDDLLDTDPPLLILTDLTRVHTDVDTVFQVGEVATLGVDTVLGEGAPFFFIADLITNPTVIELRNPTELDQFQQAARFLLDSEKPANTYYQLRVRAHTMQLSPPGEPMDNTLYAQIGVTTLLWDEPWIFDSEF